MGEQLTAGPAHATPATAAPAVAAGDAAARALDAPPADPAARLHARALAAAARGERDQAWRGLRAALRARPAPERRARILVSLAFHEADGGSLAAALGLLDEAESAALPDQVRGIVALQRGLLHLRAGATAPALAGFDAAVTLLDESEPEDICRALLHRGQLHLAPGTLRRAAADLARCRRLAAAHGLDELTARARHHLGHLALLTGDVPAALREMDAAAPVLAPRSPAAAAAYHVDRARALLTAGLLHEADRELHRAAHRCDAAADGRDAARIALSRARIAHDQGRWSDARAHAAAAREVFAAHDAAAYLLVADAIILAADLAAGRALAAVQTAGTALAARLRAGELYDDARRAALTAASATLHRRDHRAGTPAQRAAAARQLAGDGLRLRRDDPLPTRMQARALRADLADAEGRADRALAELRGAVGDMHAHQASFGNLDVQAAAAHVAHLADRGLRRALTQGVPAAVFAWVERARALSARPTPVSAPADPVGAEMLAELHHASDALRAGELSGRPDSVLRARCLALHRQLRQRAWYPPDPREAARPASLRDVVAALGDGTLVVYLAAGDEAHALVATAHHRRVQRLGAVGPLHELHRRWRADLDALAGGALPHPLRAAVDAASRGAARRLDDTLLRPLSDQLGDGPLLVAAPTQLTVLPWPLLPSLRGRPVTVVRSTTDWLRHRNAAPLPDRPRVALVAGPGVAHADAEAARVGAVWEQARALTGQAATAAAVREAAGRSDVLHLAAHGVHEPDNPLFSYLELADGPLYGYQCDRWERPPRHVVLSAGELRASDGRPGDEAPGMPAALLHGGVGSVVAGVARVGDEVAHAVGPAYHAALRRGLPPAAALAEVAAEASGPCPLVCFGAGW